MFRYIKHSRKKTDNKLSMTKIKKTREKISYSVRSNNKPGSSSLNWITVWPWTKKCTQGFLRKIGWTLWCQWSDPAWCTKQNKQSLGGLETFSLCTDNGNKKDNQNYEGVQRTQSKIERGRNIKMKQKSPYYLFYNTPNQEKIIHTQVRTLSSIEKSTNSHQQIQQNAFAIHWFLP